MGPGAKFIRWEWPPPGFHVGAFAVVRRHMRVTVTSSSTSPVGTPAGAANQEHVYLCSVNVSLAFANVSLYYMNTNKHTRSHTLILARKLVHTLSVTRTPTLSTDISI